jgi:hypothetical protein
MVRGKMGSSTSGPLDQYVNDRPYLASSFLRVAIANVFGSAMKGKCKERPELVDSDQKIVGMDVSIHSLEIAHKRIGIDRLPSRLKDRIVLFHGSLMYEDKRFAGFDTAVVMEVVEHLDPPRLAAFEKVFFKHAKPKTIIITTPNREYNAMWEGLPEGATRSQGPQI